MRRVYVVGCLLLAVIPSAGLAAAQRPPVEVPRDAVTILNEGSFWRWHETSRTPVIPAAALKAAGQDATEPKPLPGMYVDSDPPPADWRLPTFDDGAWPRASGRDFEQLIFSKLHLGVVCLRGKFNCKDLTRAGWRPTLYLTAEFRGGIVVYLNGKEVARAGMPKGKITVTTPALAYPDDLFLDNKGRPYLFPGESAAHKRIKAGDRDLVRRHKGRDRELKPVRFGEEFLRVGTNVLAVEIHRSDYHPTASGWFKQNRYGRWTPCRLTKLRLAVSGEGLTPNVVRPRSVQVWRPDGRGRMWTKSSQVWNVDRNDRVSIYDYGDPNEPIRPIRLVGARNGVFSGQVAVGWDKPIKGLKATAGELRDAGGKAVIPAEDVRVRYPRLVHYSYSAQYWYDQLWGSPPAEVKVEKRSGGATQPVFVTVHVPRDAAPGDYTGEMQVSADGIDPVAVPIHVSVADWALPEPYKYRAYAGIYQSPETLALQYAVPMWSEKHWALIEKSFQVLSYVGNDFVHVPIIERSQTGNKEGWVYWIRKEDGTYGYDFTVFDRYAALIKKHLVEPDFICLHVFRSRVYQQQAVEAMTQPHHVTQLDPKTGKLSSLRVPNYGTKESLEFWRPVVLEAKRRLAKLGLDKAICFGVLIEGSLPATLTEFKQILPQAGWVKGCHAPTTAAHPIRMKGDSRLVLQEHAYAVSRVYPLRNLPEIWQRNRVGARFYRGNAERRDLQDWRILAERNMYFGSRGFGRVALDYWPVKSGKGRAKSIYQRWPESSSAQRGVYTFRLGWPGPDGAEPTLRLEAVREGLQETEAAIFIGEAQAKHADRIGADRIGAGLAAKCRRVLVKRVRYCIERTHQPWGPIFTHVNHRGWQDLNAELFVTAAEVAAKLAPRK